LSHFQIVHFATHGLVNNEHPELSGIVLSMVNERGDPENGFLQLHDVYNLNLAAELVVLSACDTGLGKDVKGEGLVGLTRGFLYAGARSVVASLWKVEDRATAELMGHFYREMLVEGASPAAALRSAKVAMWRQRRWSAPRYWAAFVLQGDPEAVVVTGSAGRGVWPVALVSLLLAGLAAGLYVLRRAGALKRRL
jgi:CHAT domain-containing protein